MGKTYKIDIDRDKKLVKHQVEPKECPDCKGFGYIIIDGETLECERCEGLGEIE